MCVCLSLVPRKNTSKNTLRRCFLIFFFLAGAFGMFKLVKQEKMCTRGQGGGRSWIQLSLPCSRLVVVAHTPRLYPISIVYSKLSLSLHWVVQQHFVAHHLLRSFLADETHKKTERVDKYNKRLRQKQERTTPCWGALVESLNLVHGAHLKIERAHTRSI